MISGREEAKQRDPTGRLTFTEEFSSAADSDLLFTSGCVQYLEGSLAQRIESLPRKPQWVLVNLLPLHSQYDYWTLQSIGTAFCPYHIQQSAQFFSAMEKVGYRLLDKWENLEKNCWIAFEPTRSLDRYYGAAFRLQ
jgi:putative methyltransferase (TIGR04325 family)